MGLLAIANHCHTPPGHQNTLVTGLHLVLPGVMWEPRCPNKFLMSPRGLHGCSQVAPPRKPPPWVLPGGHPPRKPLNIPWGSQNPRVHMKATQKRGSHGLGELHRSLRVLEDLNDWPLVLMRGPWGPWAQVMEPIRWTAMAIKGQASESYRSTTDGGGPRICQEGLGYPRWVVYW